MRKFPILMPDVSPPARKVSRQHLDSLYNALVLLLNLHPSPYGDELIGILSFMHNYMITKLDIDADKCIALYKQLAIYWVDTMRGNASSGARFDPVELSLVDKSPVVMVDLIKWYNKVRMDNSLPGRTRTMYNRVIYTFLGGHRVIITPGKVDLKSVTAPKRGSGLVQASLIPKALANLGITSEAFMEVYRSKCTTAKLNVITTAGPNGQATWSAHEDAQAVFSNKALLSAFTSFATSSNLNWILASMAGCLPAPESLSRTKSVHPVTGRLHAIEEWGGKTRIVAIIDYWTQALLSPLHDTVAEFVSKLEMDGTFDQEKIAQKVRLWTSEKDRKVYSYDLTAATDRLPITFQRDILSFLFGDSGMAENWANILIGRDFMAPDGQMVRYSVGQPMGAKSSFPMLALTHHVIVQMSAIQANVDGYKDYVILGDDNTQTNDIVAKNYLSNMDLLGVEINMSKSVVPGSGSSAGEICKRLFIDGVEISSLPPKLLVKCTKFGYLAPQLQNIISSRGYPIAKEHVFEFFANIIDKKSLQGLLILNSVPSSVSGLTERIDPNIETLKPGRWFKESPLRDNDIMEAHIYALITEQLKRVDNLLKGTLTMAEIIESKVNLGAGPVWPTELYSGLTPAERDRALKLLPDLAWSHPIVLASQNELDRVLGHLSALRSGTPEMVSRARSGLLDLLRNSLSEIWEGDAERSSAVTRSVFNAMMGALSRICTKSDARELHFSLLLTQVQRMWSVYWKLGDRVMINVVKSRVSVSTSEAKHNINLAATDVSFDSLRL